MRRYTAVLFDLDGTLLDYEAASFVALHETLKTFGIDGDPQEIYDRYHRINQALWEEMEQGLLVVEQVRTLRFERLFRESGWAFDDIDVVSDTYLSHLSRQGRRMPGTIKLLNILKPKYKLGIITNGIAFVQRSRVRRAGLESYFESFIISEEIQAAKPDPKVFDIALEAIRCRKSDVLYVGDSISSDMAGAAAAGIDFCWMNPAGTARPASYRAVIEIRRLDELYPFLEKQDTRNGSAAGLR